MTHDQHPVPPFGQPPVPPQYGEQPLPPQYGEQPPVASPYGQPPVASPYGQQPPQYGEQPPQYGQQPLQYGGQPPLQYGGQPPVKRPTEPLAIWGLVTAFLFWPAGLVLSILASKKIKREGGEGAGLSLAGLIISIVAAVSTVIVIIMTIVLSAAAVTTLNTVVESLPTEGSLTEPEAPADDAPGSRTTPAAYGDWLQFVNESGAVEWETSVGAPTWDATAIIAADEYNEVAPAGSTYVLLPVSFRNLTTEAKTPWIETTVKFVSADGRSFDSVFASIENDATDLGDLYEGGEASGDLLFAIPSDSLVGGTWSVSYGWYATEMFVAAS
ncbi:DUF4190 domain-containing protein [Pengzhenrongella frigida]|uniref:DUF4190 domain-containing protein n=1 Tax=Pengzhenrongella frigida TaxID=1259133 RepID=UPI001F5C4F20|nr:DUF4190 domain-containing protein [Cellulomonas sp. HLT2-17]